MRFILNLALKEKKIERKKVKVMNCEECWKLALISFISFIFSVRNSEINISENELFD